MKRATQNILRTRGFHTATRGSFVATCHVLLLRITIARVLSAPQRKVQVKMRCLERLPTEILCQIIGELPLRDVRTLRLVNRSIGDVANSVAFKEICFIMRKDDFDIVRAIVDNPSCARHVTSLAYVVDVLVLERQTLEMFTNAVRVQERMDADLHRHNPKLFPRPVPKMPATEIQEKYNLYLRLYEEQEDILANDRDFAFLEQLIPRLPNLRDIVMSDGNELRIIRKASPVPRRFDVTNLYSGKYDDGAASARHLRALLKGVEKAGTRLQSIQASSVHRSILDDSQFGLHSVSPAVLEHLTTLKLVLVAVEEEEVSYMRVPDQDFLPQLEQCRTFAQKGALRRALDKMPNLVDVEIQLIEFHHYPAGTFPSPAYLRDIVPLDRVWPKLKRFRISNVETERQELAGFLGRHKSSLESFDLGYIRLTSTSWLKLLPGLKSQFDDGGRLQSARVLDEILGKSEDEFEHPEGWQLGHPDYDRPTRLGRAVTKYLVSPRKRRCPLNEDNMLERVLVASGGALDGPLNFDFDAFLDDGDQSFPLNDDDEHEEEEDNDGDFEAFPLNDGDEHEEEEDDSDDGNEWESESEDASDDGSEGGNQVSFALD